MENVDYARTLGEIADLLELQGANVFRVRAYRNAARTIETLSQSIDSLLEDEDARLVDLDRLVESLEAVRTVGAPNDALVVRTQ